MLLELTEEKLIAPELSSKGKAEIIKQMSELFSQTGIVENPDKLFEAIQKREQIESTGIGEGIAIPHTKANTVKELAIAFGGSKQGVDFNALDKKPVNLIFMVVAPEEAKGEYLQAVASIARLLKIKDLKEKLLKAKTKKDVLEVMKEFDSRFPRKMKVKTKKGRVIYGGQA